MRIELESHYFFNFDARVPLFEWRQYAHDCIIEVKCQDSAVFTGKGIIEYLFCHLDAETIHCYKDDVLNEYDHHDN